MVSRHYRWMGVLSVGALVFAFGMTQFMGAVQNSLRYDRLEAETRGKALSGHGLEPRSLLLVLGALGHLRHDTHISLARGLFGAAGGMALLALGWRGVSGRRRPRGESERPAFAQGSSRGSSPAAGRCAPLVGVRTASEPELVDDEELALLARFEALERQVALRSRG